MQAVAWNSGKKQITPGETRTAGRASAGGTSGQTQSQLQKVYDYVFLQGVKTQKKEPWKMYGTRGEKFTVSNPKFFFPQNDWSLDMGKQNVVAPISCLKEVRKGWSRWRGNRPSTCETPALADMSCVNAHSSLGWVRSVTCTGSHSWTGGQPPGCSDSKVEVHDYSSNCVFFPRAHEYSFLNLKSCFWSHGPYYKKVDILYTH